MELASAIAIAGKAIGAGLCMGIGAVGPGIGEGNAVAHALDGMAAYTNIAANAFTANTQGYRFTGWLGSNGASYSNGQFIGLSGDLTLTAQWTNLYTVVVRHSYDSSVPTVGGPDETGPQEQYALWIEGSEQPDLGKFSNPARVYQLAYGTSVGVVVGTASGADRSYITVNGVRTEDNKAWGFTVTSDMDIHFEWNYWIDTGNPLNPVQSYWNCYITTS